MSQKNDNKQIFDLNPIQINLIDLELLNLQNVHALSQSQIINLSENIGKALDLSSKLQLIAQYIKEKVGSNKQESYHFSLKDKNNRSGSIFRQFQESLKIEQIQGNNIKTQPKVYVCKSKRKIRPVQLSHHKNLQDLVGDLDNNANYCSVVYDRKLKRQNSVKQHVRSLKQSSFWLYNEYFYSNVDRVYFKEEDLLRKMLLELQFDPEKLTYETYNTIKLSLPRPKLFSQDFIISQIELLNEMRNKSRLISKQRSRNDSQYNIGNQVIAIHPVCGHLHSGSIFAVYKENQYMIKFFKPELGTEKVMDINISLKEPNNINRFVVQNIDFQLMATTFKLLQYKSQLINLLKEYNKAAQAMIKNGQTPDNKFYQEYGWIGSNINILTLGMKPILSRFRIRGIDKNNQEKIGKNFSSYLLNPFNLMYKQYQKSKENQINVVNPIKRIIETCKQSKTQYYSREIFAKYWQKLNISILPLQIRDEISKTLKSFVSLLINLRLENKNFNISENRYLKQIVQRFDNNFPQHINQIYETLASITAKINQEKM